MIAALVSFRTGWKATALPPSQSEKKEDPDEVSPSLVAGYDVAS